MPDSKNTSLNSLVNDPETVREILSGDKDPTAGMGLNPLKIVNEAKELEQPENRVLIEVLKGNRTPEAIAETLDISEEEAEVALSELRLSGYLEETTVDNETVFRISTVWRKEEFPSGPVIPLVYQFNLLSDENRMGALKEAINDVVTEGDIVADLGAGAGILSYLAARQADRVYAVEVNQDVYEHGQRIIKNQSVDNVVYIQGDARSESLPEQVDVVMCEMLDTALIAELQVPVMNRAVRSLLKSDGKTIPHGARTTVSLIETDYRFFGGEFRLPHFEEYGSRESRTLSDKNEYHNICFQRQNDLFVNEIVTVTASESGIVNGIQLNTFVQFSENIEETEGSSWLNPPLNLPTETDIPVDTGDKLEVNLKYELGGGLNNIDYSVSKLED